MKTLLKLCLPILVTTLFTSAIKAQEIERYIDRFELRSSDMHGNGWSHYYIPKSMGDTLTVKMSCVYIGRQTHAPHTHNEDEAFYIIRGPVNFHVNNEERVLQTGDFIYTPSGSSHNIGRLNSTDTIKYLVLKRETTGSVATPFPVAKANYTYDDCVRYASSTPGGFQKQGDTTAVLLDPRFSSGFQVTLHISHTPGKTYHNTPGPQTAIYIIEGNATGSLNAQSSPLYSDNTLYCPRGSSWGIRHEGPGPLMFLSIKTD